MNERHFEKMGRRAKYGFYHLSCVKLPRLITDANGDAWLDEWGEKQYTRKVRYNIFRCWVYPGMWQTWRGYYGNSIRYDFTLDENETKIVRTMNGEYDGVMFNQHTYISQNEFKKICENGVYGDISLIKEMVRKQILENKLLEEQTRLEELQDDFE